MTWRLGIHHTTGYRYDREVVSSYNEARLTPHTMARQLTLEARVETTPHAPQYRYWDYWGTQVTAFEVPDPHDSLVVEVRSVVETSADQAPPTEAPDWSVLQDPRTRDRRYELLTETPRTAADDEMAAAAAEAVVGLAPTDAALALSELAADRVEYVRGSTGVKTSAGEAWRLQRGVCQDIAHVSLALMRSVGLPARYVSGYLHPRKDAEVGATVTGESHAWVEVWLGAWWPYDPTNRVRVGQRHVVVARGREYGDVPPLRGVYRGRSSQALGVRVDLTRLQ